MTSLPAAMEPHACEMETTTDATVNKDLVAPTAKLLMVKLI